MRNLTRPLLAVLSSSALIAGLLIGGPVNAASSDQRSGPEALQRWEPTSGEDRASEVASDVEELSSLVEAKGAQEVVVTSVTNEGPIAKKVTLTEANVDSRLESIADDESVLSIQKNGIGHGTTAFTQGSGASQSHANQWDHPVLEASAAWQQATGAGVTVAVVDSGVDGNHQEFRSRVLKGIDLVEPSRDGRYDPHGHGTHVAGIIAAARDGVGTTGLAPDSRILPIRVLNSSNAGTYANFANGITAAVNRGADIINLSLAGTTPFNFLPYVNYARSKGVSVVVAAGNSGNTGNAKNVIADTPGVIAVGSTKTGDIISAFSTHHAYVTVSAPGEQIYSTKPNNLYQANSGTSMATPQVAAALALLKEKRKKYYGATTATSLERHLVNTAIDRGLAGKDDYFGWGRIRPTIALNQIAVPGITATTSASASTTTSKVTIAVQTKRGILSVPQTGSVTLTATPQGKAAKTYTLQLNSNGQAKLTTAITRNTAFKVAGTNYTGLGGMTTPTSNRRIVSYTPKLKVKAKKRTVQISTSADYTATVVLRKGKSKKKIKVKAKKSKKVKLGKGTWVISLAKSSLHNAAQKKLKVR